MHALRAGLKRIDNKKNKERRGKQADRSTEPILGFHDSDGTSPVKNPMSWEEFSLKEDVQLLLSSENLPHRFHENTGSFTESSMTFDPMARTTGDESSPINPASWEPMTEYEENIPPANDHSTSKVKKISKWKQVIRTGEIGQPLLVESMANSSIGMNADRLTPRNIISRWDPIEHDESTEPLSRRSKNDPSGKQMMQVRATFDPFESVDDFVPESHENSIHQRHNFSTIRRNFQSFRTDTTGMNQIHQINQQSNPFHEFHRGGNLNNRSFQNEEFPFVNNGDRDSSMECFDGENQRYSFGNANRDSSMECFDGEICSFQEIEYRKIRNDFATKDVKSFDMENERLASDVYETRQPTTDNENVMTESTFPHQREIESSHRGYEFSNNQIDRADEHGNSISFDKELPFSNTNEDNSNRMDAKDFEETSTDIDDKIYSVKKMEHIRSIYESKYLRVDPESPKKVEGIVEEDGAASFDSVTEEDDTNTIGLTFVALLSEFSGTLKQRTEQERAISILEARNISNVERVDGSSLNNRGRRNSLFEVSGERGKYPQFFLQKDPNIIVYLGDFEWLQYMNDIGSLNDETIFGVSHSVSARTESTQNNGVNDKEADVLDSNLQTVNDHNSTERDLPFSDRAEAFNAYKEKQFREDICPHEQEASIGKLSSEDEEQNCQDITKSVNSRFSLGNTTPTDIESEGFSEIESIDGGEKTHPQDFVGIYDNTDVPNEVQSEVISCESASIQNSDYDGPKIPKVFSEAAVGTENATMNRDVKKFDSRLELNESRCIADETPTAQIEEESNIETRASTFSCQSGKKGRKTILTSAGALLDIESGINGVPTQPPSSSIEAEKDSKDEEQHNLEVTKFDKYSENPGSNLPEIETEENVLSIDIPLQRKNEIDTCSDFDKPDPPRVGKTEEERKAAEKQARRRARWKRRIIAEHLGKQAVDVHKNSSSKVENPIGSSLNEIEMINKFLTILGPDFDGSLSSKELEDLHHRSKNAGLTRDFTEKMLSTWRGKNEPDTPSTQPSPTTSDGTYDDHGFTRKTPKPQSKMDCFVETLWAESSNIVGGDMVQNIQAALSGDGEDSTESKSRWRSVGMIESIKSSLSGDSSERGWSSDVIGSIKAAFSMDSESKSGSWSSENPSGDVKATSTDLGRTESNDSEEGLFDKYANTSDINSSLHEC